VRVPATFALLVALCAPAHAICTRPIDYSEVETIRAASTVFVATITSVRLGSDYQVVKGDAKRQRARPWYTVEYLYEVSIRFKGDPASVPFLSTAGVYNDPKLDSNRTYGEQSRFVPGDNILVVTSEAGPVAISWLRDCTDSWPWDKKSREVIKEAGLRPAP
jgi:hypothetical protein